MMNYYYTIAAAAAVVAAILLTLRSNWIEMIPSVAFLIVVYLTAVTVVVLQLAEYSQREEAAEAAARSYVVAAVEVMPWMVLVVSYS